MSLTAAQQNKPACFGFAAAFSFIGACPQCPFFATCEREVAQRVEALSGKINLQDLAGKHAAHQGGLRAQPVSAAPVQVTLVGVERTTPSVKVKLTPEQQLQMKRYPDRAAKVLRGIYERGIHVQIIERIKAKQNPFRSYPYLYAAVQSLINRGSFTRAELVRVYQQGLGWKYSSAVTYASIATSICRGLGIVEERDGRLMFVPNPKGNDH